MHGPEEWRSRSPGRKLRWMHRIRPIGLLHTLVLETAVERARATWAQRSAVIRFGKRRKAVNCRFQVNSTAQALAHHHATIALGAVHGEACGDEHRQRATPRRRASGATTKQAMAPIASVCGSGASSIASTRRRGPALHQPATPRSSYASHPCMVPASMRAALALRLSAALRSFHTTTGWSAWPRPRGGVDPARTLDRPA